MTPGGAAGPAPVAGPGLAGAGGMPGGMIKPAAGPEGWGAPASTTQGTGGVEGSTMGPSQALAFARQHLGEHEIADRSKLQSFFAGKGIKIDPASTAWCAAFVNANLKQAGLKGTGSLAAGSFVPQRGFKGWGEAVDPSKGIQAGDVGVVRGISPRTGIEGKHVGMLTGQTRMVNGQLQVEMLAGNERDRVATSWRPASSLHIRRATAAEGAGGGGQAQPPSGGAAGEARVPFTTGVPTEQHAQPSGGIAGESVPATPAGSGGNEYLRQQRAEIFKQLEGDPQALKHFQGVIARESSASGKGLAGTRATIEALVNRVAMVREKTGTNYSIEQELSSKFYSTRESGRAGARSAQEAKAIMDQAAEVKAGSDLIKSRMNQGSPTDPGAKLGGQVPVAGTSEVFNWWEGQRAGKGFSVSSSRKWAEENERKAAASRQAGGQSTLPSGGAQREAEQPPGAPPTPTPTPGTSAGGAAWHAEMERVRAASRPGLKLGGGAEGEAAPHKSGGGLLTRTDQATEGRDDARTVDRDLANQRANSLGGADVNVHFSNVPRHVKTSAKGRGAFKDLRVHQTPAMGTTGSDGSSEFNQNLAAG